MSWTLPKPKMTPWSRVDTKVVGDYRVFRVQHHGIKDASGAPRRDVFTFTCPDWCNVVAITDQGELVLIWQYRFGSDALALELPGGVIDEGETPLEAARRELLEETGYTADTFEPLLSVQPNPALQDNWCHCFLARGARRVAKPSFDENEECELALIPVEQTSALLRGGHVTHSLCIVGLDAYLKLP